MPQEHPEARPLIAANPAAYDGLLHWLAQFRDPHTDAALAGRYGLVALPPAASLPVRPRGGSPAAGVVLLVVGLVALLVASGLPNVLRWNAPYLLLVRGAPVGFAAVLIIALLFACAMLVSPAGGGARIGGTAIAFVFVLGAFLAGQIIFTSEWGAPYGVLVRGIILTVGIAVAWVVARGYRGTPWLALIAVPLAIAVDRILAPSIDLLARFAMGGGSTSSIRREFADLGTVVDSMAHTLVLVVLPVALVALVARALARRRTRTLV